MAARALSPGRHEAVLLAAGGSTRLGTPKQLLTRAGETLLRRTARLLAGTRPRNLIVVLGANADGLTRELDGLHAEVVVNPHWQRGLASSLHAAASVSSGDADVLVSVCDQPALESPHFAALLAAGGAAATRHGTRLGVPALIDPATWSRVHELQGDRGFGALLDAAGYRAIEAPELDLDLDTADDVAIARARGWLD